jgi:hypothetical protein
MCPGESNWPFSVAAMQIFRYVKLSLAYKKWIEKWIELSALMAISEKGVLSFLATMHARPYRCGYTLTTNVGDHPLGVGWICHSLRKPPPPRNSSPNHSIENHHSSLEARALTPVVGSLYQ